MILADTMAIFFSVLGTLLAFNGVWLLVRSLAPSLVAHATDAHKDGMVKSFLLGLPLSALVIVTAGALGEHKQGPSGLIALMVLSVYFLVASIGVCGIASLLGERLRAQEADSGAEPAWRTVRRGGMVLSLSYLFPFVGWFFILPVSLVVGFGATIRAFFRARSKGAAPSRQAAAAPGNEPEPALDGDPAP